ncbi:MAG: septum formation initiator family protein [Candidatus Jettenia sp.]|nr:MAG: septum formation initiator family protein [Candidatus Jettenia sp.]
MQDGKVNREGDEHPSQSSLPGEGPNTISPSMKEKFAELSGEDTTVKDSLEINSEKNTYFARLLLMIGITSCVVILFSSIISKVRQERYRMLEEKKTLEKQAAQLETSSSQLENEYSALKNDPIRIEKEAREQYGFIKPDEILYTKYNFRIKSITKKEPVKEVTQNRWKVFFFEGPFRWQLPALIILLATAFYIISYHYEYRKLHKSNR